MEVFLELTAEKCTVTRDGEIVYTTDGVVNPQLAIQVVGHEVTRFVNKLKMAAELAQRAEQPTELVKGVRVKK